MEKEKKVYHIGDMIQKNEILGVAQGITKKAINVVASSGNRIAIELQERKHIELFEDLSQSVAMILIENNYIITKECYKIVNNIIYNVKKNEYNIESIDDEKEMERESYILFEKELYKKEKERKFNISDLQLTEKQLEILNIYCKLGTYGKTAKLLGVAKSTVQTTIERIKQKASYILINE